ncbi:uroporphyrinogen-III synthase [Bacteroidota bacterium]
MKVRNILVSQPKPSNGKSPYYDLSEKHKIKIDFRPFIQVKGLSGKEFRASKINILNHSAVIFSSKTAIDHYFRICKELRVAVPDSMKYFCITEQTAFYLQKYIVYRKRKIFYGKSKIQDLIDILLKHKEEKFLVPLSDIHKEEIPMLLTKNQLNFTKAIFYKTISSDLSDLADVNYDILVFYSPSGIISLLENFPEFKQNSTKIASFGATTLKAVKEAGLKANIQAPNPKAPSMTMALDQFILDLKKK